jgi:hypothetical protein
MQGKMIFLVVLMTLPSLLFARESWFTGTKVEKESTHALNHRWKGTWTDSEGYLYHGKVKFEVTDEGKVEGVISWTLVKSPRLGEQSKLGRTGRESVKGSYDEKTRVLSFAGNKKDDPYSVIGLDRYRLILAENDKVIGGITWDHGTWRGLCSLVRY